MHKISEKQYTYLNKKYGKLMYSIAMRISGDALYTIEDNVQMLWIAAHEAMEGFRKTCGYETFEGIEEDPQFDPYFKTCLWNKKNNIGLSICRKMPSMKTIVVDDKGKPTIPRYSRKDNVEFSDSDETNFSGFVDVEDSKSNAFMSEIMLRDLCIDMDEDQLKAMDLLIKNPELIKSSGKISLDLLRQYSGWTASRVKRVVNSIRVLGGGKVKAV